MSERPTLLDVATRAGVSTAVVSYVVNNGPRKVLPETRKKVEAAIKDLGYRRNAMASALMKGQSNLIGLLVPNTANAFFGELAAALEQEARKRGFLAMLGNTSHDPRLEHEYEMGLADLRARAVFVSSSSANRMEKTGCPRVYVHSAPTYCDDPVVRFDNVAGGHMAARHLLGLGRRNIHCLAGAYDFGPFAERTAGWKQALLACGRTIEGSVHKIADDRVHAVSQIKSILSAPKRPDALFATGDEQAIAALRAAAELGLSVPADLAVVGFGVIREAVHGTQPLTTIETSVSELAREAFNALLDPKAHGGQAILPPRLLIGATCGASQ